MCICGIHRGVDDPWRNRVETDTLARKFNRQRTCDRLQPPLCEVCKTCRNPRYGLACERRRDIHDMAELLPAHLLNGELGNVEEPRKVCFTYHSELFDRVFGEGLRDKNSRIVHQQINSPKILDRDGDYLLRGLLKSNIAIDQFQIGRVLQGHRRLDVARICNYAISVCDQPFCYCETYTA